MVAKCLICQNNLNLKSNDLKIYRFPLIDDRSEIHKLLSKKRQKAWLKAINKSDLKESEYKNIVICSKHFISGSCAHLLDKSNPDWVPSLHLNDAPKDETNKKTISFKTLGKQRKMAVRIRRSNRIKRVLNLYKVERDNKHLNDVKIVNEPFKDYNENDNETDLLNKFHNDFVGKNSKINLEGSLRTCVEDPDASILSDFKTFNGNDTESGDKTSSQNEIDDLSWFGENEKSQIKNESSNKTKSTDPPKKFKHQSIRKSLDKNRVKYLRAWLYQNRYHAYPSDQEKKELCKQTGFTYIQISNWFINARRRLLPLYLKKEGIILGQDSKAHIIRRRKRKPENETLTTPNTTILEDSIENNNSISKNENNKSKSMIEIKMNNSNSNSETEVNKSKSIVETPKMKNITIKTETKENEKNVQKAVSPQTKVEIKPIKPALLKNFKLKEKGSEIILKKVKFKPSFKIQANSPKNITEKKETDQETKREIIYASNEDGTRNVIGHKIVNVPSGKVIKLEIYGKKNSKPDEEKKNSLPKNNTKLMDHPLKKVSPLKVVEHSTENQLEEKDPLKIEPEDVKNLFKTNSLLSPELKSKDSNNKVVQKPTYFRTSTSNLQNRLFSNKNVSRPPTAIVTLDNTKEKIVLNEKDNLQNKMKNPAKILPKLPLLEQINKSLQKLKRVQSIKNMNNKIKYSNNEKFKINNSISQNPKKTITFLKQRGSVFVKKDLMQTPLKQLSPKNDLFEEDNLNNKNKSLNNKTNEEKITPQDMSFENINTSITVEGPAKNHLHENIVKGIVKQEKRSKCLYMLIETDIDEDDSKSEDNDVNNEMEEEMLENDFEF